MYYNNDGTVDETQDDSAKALGEWNTTDRNPKPEWGFDPGTQHNIAELVTLPSPDMVYRTGYMLIGWSTKVGATQPDPGLAYIDEDGDGIPEKAPTNWTMPAEETTLHAVWSPERIELIYEPDDEERLVVPPAPTLGYTDCVASITEEIPVRPGYTFVGWANASGSEKPDYVAKDNYDLDPPIVSKIPSGSGGADIVVKTNPNIVYGVWTKNSIWLEYWGVTEESELAGTGEVMLKRMEVSLDDWFDHKYNQNYDVDDNGNYITWNDHIAYRPVGWWDDTMSYFADYSLDDPQVTIQELADVNGYDGTDPNFTIYVHSELELRVITVTYDCFGYEAEAVFNSVRQFTWYDSPVLDGITWAGYTCTGSFDENFTDLDSSMDCAFILTNLIGDPLLDDLFIYMSWEAVYYTVHYVHPGSDPLVNSIVYTDELQVSLRNDYDNPGYELVGWFTEPEGQGIEVFDATTYASLISDDTITDLYLYAYWVPAAGGTSSSPAEGADDIANSTGGNGGGIIMGPAGSDDVTDELPGNVSLVVDDVLSSVRLPQLVGASTIGVVEASRALTGAEAMVATYAAPAVAVYEVAGEPQSSRTSAGNVTTVSRTATNNSYGTNATQASVLSAITDSILTEASQVRIATPVADQISASVHAANAGVASLTGTVCSGSSVPAFPTSIATSMAPVAVVPATTRREV